MVLLNKVAEHNGKMCQKLMKFDRSCRLRPWTPVGDFRPPGSLNQPSHPLVYSTNATMPTSYRRMGVDHGGKSPPQNLKRGIVPQVLSCCKILSTRLLALQCRKIFFCLYSRTFIVSPAMRPPQNSSQMYAYV